MEAHVMDLRDTDNHVLRIRNRLSVYFRFLSGIFFSLLNNQSIRVTCYTDEQVIITHSAQIYIYRYGWMTILIHLKLEKIKYFVL